MINNNCTFKKFKLILKRAVRQFCHDTSVVHHGFLIYRESWINIVKCLYHLIVCQKTLWSQTPCKSCWRILTPQEPLSNSIYESYNIRWLIDDIEDRYGVELTEYDHLLFDINCVDSLN